MNPDRIPIQLGLNDPDPGRPEKPANIGEEKKLINFIFCSAGLKASSGAWKLYAEI